MDSNLRQNKNKLRKESKMSKDGNSEIITSNKDNTQSTESIDKIKNVIISNNEKFSKYIEDVFDEYLKISKYLKFMNNLIIDKSNLFDQNSDHNTDQNSDHNSTNHNSLDLDKIITKNFLSNDIKRILELKFKDDPAKNDEETILNNKDTNDFDLLDFKQNLNRLNFLKSDSDDKRKFKDSDSLFSNIDNDPSQLYRLSTFFFNFTNRNVNILNNISINYKHFLKELNNDVLKILDQLKIIFMNELNSDKIINGTKIINKNNNKKKYFKVIHNNDDTLKSKIIGYKESTNESHLVEKNSNYKTENSYQINLNFFVSKKTKYTNKNSNDNSLNHQFFLNKSFKNEKLITSNIFKAPLEISCKNYRTKGLILFARRSPNIRNHNLNLH